MIFFIPKIVGSRKEDRSYQSFIFKDAILQMEAHLVYLKIFLKIGNAHLNYSRLSEKLQERPLKFLKHLGYLVKRHFLTKRSEILFTLYLNFSLKKSCLSVLLHSS